MSFFKAQPGMYSGMKDVKHLNNYKCHVKQACMADNKHIIKKKK